VAVTVADYQARAEGLVLPDGSQPIQRANASFKWTGSWLTVSVGAEARGTETLDPTLAADVLDYLDDRRLAGYDIEVHGPDYVPIELIVELCAARGFRPADVQRGLEQILSSASSAAGQPALFRPGNFNFGDNLYVSQIYATAMSVPGVESLRIARLARLHAKEPDSDTLTNLSQGFLAAGPDQIVRLDNDHNFPENGAVTVKSREVVA
jgi:hypothetical protein